MEGWGRASCSKPGCGNDSFLTYIQNFSAVILRKKIIAIEIPLFHLWYIMCLIISMLYKVELGWNYRWNFM